MAQNLKAELTKQEPMVDLLAGPDSYRQLPILIDHALQAKKKVRMSSAWRWIYRNTRPMRTSSQRVFQGSTPGLL